MGLFSSLFSKWSLPSLFYARASNIKVSQDPYSGDTWLDLRNTTENNLIDFSKFTRFSGSKDQHWNVNQEVYSVITGSGSDTLIGDSRNNNFITQAGDDYLDGGQGNDTLAGGAGNDTYYVDSPNDTVVERVDEGDRDSVHATSDFTLGDNQAIEYLFADQRREHGGLSLKGNALQQIITGWTGNDTLDGGGGGDNLAALGGDDTYIVRSSEDTIVEYSNGGRDRVIVNVANYQLTRYAEIERIEAGSDARTIVGNEFAQTIVGNDANNIIDGGLGNDTLDGGDKSGLLSILWKDVDTFRFSTALGADNIDTITNFHLAKEGVPFLSSTPLGGVFSLVTNFIGSLIGQSTESDKIALSQSVFTGIGLGQLNESTFCTLGTEGITASDRILYQTNTGGLYYDADGSGPVAAIQFANVEAGLAMKASCFFVYA